MHWSRDFGDFEQLMTEFENKQSDGYKVIMRRLRLFSLTQKIS
jgi:hypothetical protein